jgi:hypothetical protein
LTADDSTMALPDESSAPKDFDFIIGDWTVRHRRLDKRLSGCSTWTEFAGRSSTRKTLGGFGNLEDNLLHFPEGAFRAIAIRSWCAQTRTWSIWWLDGRNPTRIDKPVVGGFTGDTGLFYTDDVLDGRAIRVRFTWIAAAGQDPRWEQAFSADGGLSWETNWTMQFTRG